MEKFRLPDSLLEHQKHCKELLAKQKPASKEEMLAQMRWHLYGDSIDSVAVQQQSCQGLSNPDNREEP